MQLSILIPVYNYFVRGLVEDLYAQATSLDITFEIVLVDDFSEEEFYQENKKLRQYSNVIFERLKRNIGRSKIRNYLIKKARYQNCLVLDCDVSIISQNFIKMYIENIDVTSVIVGGHQYQSKRPTDTSLLLHWKYGSQVEYKSYNERLKKPLESFMTNSFLIQKETSSLVKFEESIYKYGHEDTLYGIELEKKNIYIKHIDNPVLHLGLKQAKDFLFDEKQAIENLILLSNNSDKKKGIIQKSKLLRYENSMLLSMYYFFAPIFLGNDLEKNLLSDNPSLRVLKFWKYKMLTELRKKQKIKTQ